MRARTRKLNLLAAAVVAGVLAPMAGAAQQGSPDHATVERIVQAEQEANVLLQVRHGWRRSAELFERSATLRGDADPIAVTDLEMAGGAYYWSGNVSRAGEMFVRGGDRALAIGQVDRAADLYIRGAFVAKQRGDGQGEADLARRAGKLALSPMLTEAQRQHILGYLRHPVDLAARQPER